MYRVFLFILICLILSKEALAIELDLTQRTFEASRIEFKAPLIDGRISDEAWLSADVLTNFIQNTPIPKVSGTQNTEVRMIYDDEAIYIAARMYERNTDSIYNFLTERDDFGNADFFIAVFNPYKDGINGDGFAVTPANVQIDIKYSLNEESTTWDAVWESATHIDELGWTVEMKIPYSALRFPEKSIQEWGINFGREIRRNRERDWWNSIDPAVDGFFTQAGIVKGIKDIKPPTRLFFFPYASAYYEVNSSEGAPDNSSFNGGMDVKYGINDAFTLDMTLIPDFGQVRFDDQVLNLTPFEVQFDENRQFFTEGVELFNKAGIFYSRRIGGRPYAYDRARNSVDEGERVIENPVQSKLLNATKISGRTDGGLGIGFFNAFDDESYAVIANEELGSRRRVKTNPYTNYNMLVLDQVLRNNSFVTFTNTNVLRDGLARDANVARLDLQLADKKNRYALSGFASMSHLWQEDGSLQSGESWRAAMGKISGNFTFELSQEVIGRDYDPNDLGFQTVRNVQNSTLFAQLVKYENFSIFNFYRHEFELIYQRLQQPNDFLNLGFSWFTVYRLKSFHALSLNAGFEPINTNDYFETRNFDLYYDYPRNFWFGGFFSSDYSRVFALDLRTNNRYFDEPSRRFHSYEIAPRFRPNDKLFFVISYQNRQSINDIGFVNNVSDSVIFGRRDVIENETAIEGNYIFNNTMALNLIFRHYWSEAVYNRFNRVDPDNGKLLETDYPGFRDDGSSIHDISFNAFNIDLAFNWRFAPGSEISVVWKNIILQSGDPLDLTYYQNLEETLRAPQLNNFSIRILYFIDYLSLKGRG